MLPSDDHVTASSREPVPPMRRRAATWLFLLLAVVLAGGGWYAWREFAPRVTAAEAEAGVTPPPPPQVTVSLPLVKRITEWDEYTGQFEAVEEVEIRARVSGYLESVNFVDGQIVEKGDLLYVIDPRPYEIARQSAEAQFAAAQAAVDLAQAQLTRAEALQKNDFVSKSAYDERVQENRAAAANVGIAHAAVAAARLDLEYTRIVAPITGRISATRIDVGNLVSGGSTGATTLLTTIVATDPIRLVFDISESNLLAYQRAIQDGRLPSLLGGTVPVQARLMDETGWTMKGSLEFVDNQVDRSAGTIRVRALLPNPDGIVTPGQFGQARIPGSEPYDAILVPESALVTDQAQKMLLTVAEDGTVVSKPVRAGPNRGPQLRIIRSGLEPTDRIIISGLLRARPGAKVSPVDGSFDLPDPEE